MKPGGSQGRPLPATRPSPPSGRAWSLILLSAAFLARAAAAASVPNAPLEPPYSLRGFHPFPLEHQYSSMIAGGGRLGFVFPAPCPGAAPGGASAPGRADGNAGFCGEAYPGRYRLRHDDGNQWIGFSPLLGVESRREEEDGATVMEGGAVSAGAMGAASFYLDARIFAGEPGPWGPAGYDREGFDSQEESGNGAASYDSYARYRGNLNFDLPFGRLTAARDAVHWGPGLFHNLVFHQQAVPFHHLAFTTTLGPLRVATLYGSLAIAPGYIDTLNLSERNVYAHRYELSLGRDVLLGVSEQIVLHDQNLPFLFVPVFPLFIAKGFMYEHANNSNLAFDAAWRMPGGILAYGEFLLDDLESPASLFTKDYIQNKWAFNVGLHGLRELGGVTAGAVLEWSRVEPWVYTHFEPNTAQAANLGYPLGNPSGPNSSSVQARLYGRSPRFGHLSLQLGWLWKGTDPGSAINDDVPGYQFTSKSWLAGVDGPEFTVQPAYSLEWGPLAANLALELGGARRMAAGIRARY